MDGNWAIKATKPTMHPQVSPAAGLLCLHRVGCHLLRQPMQMSQQIREEIITDEGDVLEDT